MSSSTTTTTKPTPGDLKRKESLSAVDYDGDVPMQSRAPTVVSEHAEAKNPKLAKRLPSTVDQKSLRVVIVGGVAGGASAAARMRRLNETAEIILLQSGPDVSFASCGMPYYLGGEITDRPGMAVQTPASLKAKLNLDVRVNTHVTEIDTSARRIVCHPTSPSSSSSSAADAADPAPTDGDYTLEYDELVLAVGAEPFKPPIPGIDRPGLFSLRNLQDMDDIKEWMTTQASKHSDPGDLHYVVAGAGVSSTKLILGVVACLTVKIYLHSRFVGFRSRQFFYHSFLYVPLMLCAVRWVGDGGTIPCFGCQRYTSRRLAPDIGSDGC